LFATSAPDRAGGDPISWSGPCTASDPDVELIRDPSLCIRAGWVAEFTRAEPPLATRNKATGWVRREDARVSGSLPTAFVSLFLGCLSAPGLGTEARQEPQRDWFPRPHSLCGSSRPSVNTKESGAPFGPDSTEARREPQRHVSPRIPFVPSAFRGQCLSAVVRDLCSRSSRRRPDQLVGSVHGFGSRRGTD